MAAVSATTIRNTAYNVIISRRVTKITTSNYSAEEYIQFKTDILDASMAVPSSQGGGKHGHAFLVEDEDEFKDLSGLTTVTTKMTVPDSVPTIEATDSHATIAHKTAEVAVNLDKYHTQEGVEAGLKELVIKSVPKAALEEIKDRRFKFANKTTIELLQHLKAQAEIVDIHVLGDMLREREEKIDFEGDETLKTFFHRIDKIIKDLKFHKVESSMTSMMTDYLLQITAHGGDIMRTALDAWNTTDKSTMNEAAQWKKFKEVFSDADKTRRQAMKCVRDGYGRESANMAEAKNEEATKERITEVLEPMLAAALNVISEATLESVNAAVESKFKTHGSNTQANDDDTSALAKRIKSLEQQLKEAKKVKSGSNDASNEGRRKCKTCGRAHKGQLDDECWTKPENRASAPDWWKKRNPE